VAPHAEVLSALVAPEVMRPTIILLDMAIPRIAWKVAAGNALPGLGGGGGAQSPGLQLLLTKALRSTPGFDTGRPSAFTSPTSVSALRQPIKGRKAEPRSPTEQLNHYPTYNKNASPRHRRSGILVQKEVQAEVRQRTRPQMKLLDSSAFPTSPDRLRRPCATYSV